MSTTDPWLDMRARIAELEVENERLRGGRASIASPIEPRSCDTVDLDCAFEDLQVAARDYAWNGGDRYAESLTQQAVSFVIAELETEFPDVEQHASVTLADAIKHLHSQTLDGWVAQFKDEHGKREPEGK